MDGGGGEGSMAGRKIDATATRRKVIFDISLCCFLSLCCRAGKASASQMKAVLEKTPHAQWESFHCEVVRGASYNAMWHFHPEVQLTLVLESRGHRMVGDNISPLHPGDLVLVGSNLPHVWHQDAAYKRGKVHAIIVRFLDTFLGAEFLAKPELEPVRQLLRRAARGLQVTARTRDLVAGRMQRLAEASALSRIVELLAILDLWAARRRT